MILTIRSLVTELPKPFFVLFLIVACSSSAQATITLTFANNATPLDPYPSTGTFSGVFTAPMGQAGFIPKTGIEFRMIDPANKAGGGGEKSILDGGEQWIFGDNINLTAVANTPMTGGSSVAGSAAPAGDVGLHVGAPFFNAEFNFLAPTVGSAAAIAYGGPGVINIDPVSNIMTVVFPVLEAQWADTHFPLGLLDDGIHGDKIAFTGSVVNLSSAAGTTTFDFVLTAEHLITAPDEDPGVAGFTTWTPQWEMPGSGSAPDSIFFVPDSPTSDTGTVIPTPGGPADGNTFNDGRITLDEAEATFGPDIDMTTACIGSCFDYTVTGIGMANVQVTLPLSAAIPGNAVLRKYDGGWRFFDESGTDTIESAPGASGDCTAPGPYVAGLIEGSFCLRVTLANGGGNDLDGNAADTQIVDPISVAIPVGAGGGGGLIPGESLGGGCSMSTNSNSSTGHHLEYWMITGFLMWLGWNRRKKHQH